MVLLAVVAVLGLLGACRGDDAGGAPVATEFQGQVPEHNMTRPDFVLTDTEGKSFDFDRETEGKVTLLYFGYTHCPDVCPSHMADIAAALDRSPDLKDDVEVVFVTVDPDRDDSERLALWLGLFSEDFVGLTGTREEIDEATKSALGNLWFPIKTAAYGDSGEYSVSHAAMVLAYGKDDVVRVMWPFGTPKADYENDLRILVNEGDNQS
jgi:protein SCO1/2